MESDVDTLRLKVVALEGDMKAEHEAGWTRVLEEMARREVRMIMATALIVGVAATVLGVVLDRGATAPVIVNNIPPSIAAPAESNPAAAPAQPGAAHAAGR